MKYKVGVIVEFENGEEQQNKFDYWEDAADWVANLAIEGESFPAKVRMWIIRE